MLTNNVINVKNKRVYLYRFAFCDILDCIKVLFVSARWLDIYGRLAIRGIELET